MDFFHLKSTMKIFFFFQGNYPNKCFPVSNAWLSKRFSFGVAEGQRSRESVARDCWWCTSEGCASHLSATNSCLLISSPRISCLEKPQPWALWLLFTLAVLMWWAPQAGQSGWQLITPTPFTSEDGNCAEVKSEFLVNSQRFEIQRNNSLKLQRIREVFL